MIERNRKQAEVPDNCKVLKNEKGTAPGMLFQKDGKIFVSLPGVPHEMKWLMKQEVLPFISNHFQTTYIEHRTLLTYGIGESFLADRIAVTEEALPTHIKLAYLPNYGMVRLRLTASGSSKEALQKEIEAQFEALKKAVGPYLISDEDIPMEKIVSNLLIERSATVSTAESCTGGYLAHLLTSIPGASAFYKGTIVSYANEIKQQVLKVPEEVLLNHGAVSEATVTQMAKECLKMMNTDYSIAVSGIMGPDGGTEVKPVGTVWIAVANKKVIKTQLIHLRYDRERNISLTATNALNFLRMLIVDNP
jgi:nicotinamide-nucleotide amidase